MNISFFRRVSNRGLHLLARTLPGSTTIRPMLHRLRGVTIGKDVFIGDDVYLENEHPSAVEIHSGAQISVRAVLLAHTRGSGRLIIEKDAFIGPNAVVATTGNRTLRIGEGAVIGAGVVVTRSVPPRVFLAHEPAKPVADVMVPLPKAAKMEDFVRGLVPVGRQSKQSKTKAF
jgi:acetyltransferase-like isoleucine patch superfamily enzyme